MAEAKAEIFKYELCSQPSALFEPSGLLRESVLADVIWTDRDGNQMPGPSLTELSSMQNVLDRGSLLHKMPWPKGSTYNSVCDMYVNNVCRSYVKPIIVLMAFSRAFSQIYGTPPQIRWCYWC